MVNKTDLTELNQYFADEAENLSVWVELNSPIVIIKKITHFPNGKPRSRPIFEKDGKKYKTLKAARAATHNQK